MANQNQFPIGNSGSLEDCHTNLYALTDIAGIQYAKFISCKEGYVNSLDDPILIMYTKCLNAGILCSWNKAKKDEKSNLSDITGFLRELWVFWYDGNDPFSSKNIAIPNSLKEDEKGNWKNGLTYEIRSILFKALNTNFERYFLSKGFVRMGPWIQMPYKPNKHSESQYGFNVKFFLHGESTICGAIDVRNVSMVRQIILKDVLECNNQQKTEVILAPYAVRGFLTGRYFKDDDPIIKQLHEDWLKYYPLVFSQNNPPVPANKKPPSDGIIDNNPPKFVEIITGNCKMKYPSCLVCQQINLDQESEPTKPIASTPKKKENRKRCFTKMEVPDGNLFSFVARRFSDRIVKETMIPLTRLHKESDKSKSKPLSKPWRYCNSFSHAQCGCSRTKTIGNAATGAENPVATLADSCSDTFHRRLLNLEIPFTKTKLVPLESLGASDTGSTLKSIIASSKIDSSCDRCSSPTGGTVALSTGLAQQPNDPIMPTLSPQLPATSESAFPAQNGSITGGNSAGASCTQQKLSVSETSPPVHGYGPGHAATLSGEASRATRPVPNGNVHLQIGQNASHVAGGGPSINVLSGSQTAAANSRTPPPPSITPSSSIMPCFQALVVGVGGAKGMEHCSDTGGPGDQIGQLGPACKSEAGLDSGADKKSIDSLPFGIEINEKPSSCYSVVTNISVNNKTLLLARKPPGGHHSSCSDSISDIVLFPPLANGTSGPVSCSDEMGPTGVSTSCSLGTGTGQMPLVNYGLIPSETALHDAVINNRWLLTFPSHEPPCGADGSPVAKRPKQFIVHNGNSEMPSTSSHGFDCSNQHHHQHQTGTPSALFSRTPSSIHINQINGNANSTHHSGSGKHYNNYSSSVMTNEKTEHSVIPDQIFDDSDEDDNSRIDMGGIKAEMQLSNNNGSYRIGNNGTEKILSPNSAPVKVLRSSTFGKFSGTSLHSSTGSGCLNAIELSLMYPTPPSLEGTLACGGSPAERQSNHQIISSNHRSSEYNHNEYVLNSLSMSCQNWEEMDKDWSVSAVNSSVFCSGVKYTKPPEPSPREKLYLSFNHKRLNYQRNKLKRQMMDNEQKLLDRYMSITMNTMFPAGPARRPNNLIPSPFYSQSPFSSTPITATNPGPPGYTMPPSQQPFSLSRSNSQRFHISSGQNSAPMTPASVCTNPPSVESSIGTPRIMDHLNPSSSGFSRPQAVQSSPAVAKSPRTTGQSHQNVISIMTAAAGLSSYQYLKVNGLYLNVLLSDSILNLYKDHNFDSCNICVCGMSVLGNDVGLYIDEYQQSQLNRSMSQDDMAGSCTSKTECKCGFSAVMNRHYAINANLFWEDEVEITGIRKPHVYSTQAHMPKDSQEIIGRHSSSQIMSIYNEFGLSFLLDFLRFKNTVVKPQPPENLIEFQDLNAAIHRSLDQASESVDLPNNNNVNRIVSPDKSKQWLSTLYYFKKDAVIPKNYNDQIRLLMTLRPLLQEAVSNTRLLESSYTVDGPLTWKTFHRLAGRGNVESCEPQPLPRFQAFMGKHSSKDTLNASNAIPGIPSLLESSVCSQNAYTSPVIHSQFSGINNGFISGLNQFGVPPSKNSSNLSYFSTEGNPLCLSDGYPEKEKECLTISPYAVREWDKLNLEPIYRPKEIAYAVVTPTDSGKLLQTSLITYFKELNHTFEACRLGHHFSYRCSSASKDDIHSSFIEVNTEDINEKGFTASDRLCLQPEALQKHWVKELSKTMSTAQSEEFISKLLWYVKCCEHQTVSMLSQYGIHKKNGSKSTLFTTCDAQKRDGNFNINQSLDMLFSPGNGCGSLGRGLNTKIWSTDKDVYLIIYLINPFIHGQDISEPAYRLSMQRMNKLCDRISDNLHHSWKSRLTFHILSINKVFESVQFGSKTGVSDAEGSSIGGRDNSTTSSSSCTSSSVSWSLKWCRQWNWKSTAFAVYSSIRRKIGRVSGLQSVFSGKTSSSNLCSSAKCSMARGCSSDDECESAASLINANRCLTKCGPTEYNENVTSDYLKKLFLDSKDQSHLDRTYLSIYAPPYILAPSRTITYQVNTSCQPASHSSVSASESWGYVGDKSNVLFVSYCLSVDQRWLLATCTDQLGTLLRQTQINIMVPQLHLRKNASPRRIGLGKLWEFIQEVVADSCQPWRLVIGRMGRAGHGELKGWNGLLSRQNLIRANQRFRDECSMCKVWYSNTVQSHGVGSGGTGGMGSMGRCDMCAIQVPAIISGCFVSLECHSSFRIFPGSVKPEERASSNLQLCTPRDISVTHILVFPTSTSAGADQDLSGGSGNVNEMNLEELLDLRFGNEGLEELGNISNMDMSDSGFASGFDPYAIGSLNPLMPTAHSSNQHDLVSLGGLDPGMSLGGLEHGGGGCGAGGVYSAQFSNQEEGHMLMQQPLAMGYYLSTTDSGPLPAWFWAACPPPGSSESALPSCFKAALHLQTSLISQEDGSSGLSGAPGAAPHPLDSHQTCDVLRFVLESYHGLSWLTFDPAVNDRRSCLPIHILCLAQLYQADQAFM